MQIAVVFKLLDILTLLASVLTAFRLWKFGLARRYPVLTVYMLYMAPYLAGPLLLDMKSMTYYRFWLASEPLLWLLEILLVSELCGAVLAHYQGLRSLGRWTIYGGMVVSTFISNLALRAHLQSALSERSRVLALMTGIGRGINLALVIFLLIVLFLASRFPVRLSRNVILNTAIFTMFFLANTLGAILHTVFDRRLGLTADVGLAALSCLCMVAWLVFLTPSGEVVESHRLHLSENYEKHLLAQLDSLNRALLRTSE